MLDGLKAELHLVTKWLTSGWVYFVAGVNPLEAMSCVSQKGITNPAALWSNTVCNTNHCDNAILPNLLTCVVLQFGVVKQTFP